MLIGRDVVESLPVWKSDDVTRMDCAGRLSGGKESRLARCSMDWLAWGPTANVVDGVAETTRDCTGRYCRVIGAWMNRRHVTLSDCLRLGFRRRGVSQRDTPRGARMECDSRIRESSPGRLPFLGPHLIALALLWARGGTVFRLSVVALLASDGSV